MYVKHDVQDTSNNPRFFCLLTFSVVTANSQHIVAELKYSPCKNCPEHE